MKKVNNLNSSLFRKFEKEQVSNLSSIMGGYVDPPTEQKDDVSSSTADCTEPNCDSSDWNEDSDDSSDSSREAD
ncbi:hypothetical protein [Zhouia amylolytica]|nr:hypothetical protein [Zhouia amylolytica]